MTDNTMPRNASEANAQAVRMERALAIIAEGYSFERDTRHADLVTVKKPGRLITAYWIINQRCDCPDSQKGNRCKHILAWNIIEAEQNKQAGLYADDVLACEAAAVEHDDSRYNMPLPEVKHDAEHQRLMNNRGNDLTPPPFTFGQDADPQAVAILNCLRDRIHNERRNARQKGWAGRTDDLAVACTVIDEFITKYQSGWFILTDEQEGFSSGYECAKDLTDDRY